MITIKPHQIGLEYFQLCFLNSHPSQGIEEDDVSQTSFINKHSSDPTISNNQFDKQGILLRIENTFTSIPIGDSKRKLTRKT